MKKEEYTDEVRLSILDMTEELITLITGESASFYPTKHLEAKITKMDDVQLHKMEQHIGNVRDLFEE